MNNEETRPKMVFIKYEPEVSIEQILAFDTARPETHTSSAFMNAVCRSFAANGYRSSREMGRSLGVSDRVFACTFEALTGVKYNDIRPMLVERKALEFHQTHPRWTIKRIATELGFRSHASLWSILPQEVYKTLVPELKADFMRRMSKEFDESKK